MSQMDAFLPLLTTHDIMKKLSVGADVVKHLESTSDVECEDIGLFVDSIIPWTTQSNFRVAQNGLTILTLLAERMKSGFRPYLKDVLPHAVDKLGDARDTVREKAHLLLVQLMLGCLTPRQLFDRLAPALAHKSAKVREEMLLLLQDALSDHGAGAIHLTPLVAPVVSLLSDPTATVRDAAFNTLVELYKHVGERLRHDLQKKHSLPQARSPALMAMFDQVRDSGQMLPTAAPARTPSTSDGTRKDSGDEVDRVAAKSALVARSTSMPASRRPLPHKTSNGSVSSSDGRVRRAPSVVCRHSAAAPVISVPGAGAIDEATFIASFEQVPRVQIFSPKDLEDIMTNLRETISKQSNDWNVRTEALKKLRGVLMAGGADFDDLYRHLRLMEPALQLTVQDLRSQVVREGCITIAYLSQQLGHRVDHVCHSLLPYLIELIPNSAKVMSTSGVVAIRFIIQNTHHAKLVPVVTGQLSSKSREIRRACCEFLEHIITCWPTPVLERHVAAVQEAIRRGVADADAEVRATSRRAFWGFADHFREQADSLLNSLDSQHKKLLSGGMSQSGSNTSLSTPGRSSLAVSRPRSRASSRSGSQENLAGPGGGLSRAGSISRRSALPLASPAPRPDRGKSPAPSSFRSTSAIDLQAAQRASVRAQYAAAQRARAGGGQPSLLRPPSVSATPSRVGAPPVTATPGRHRSRSVTQSQPGSRSGSPSSRLSSAGGGLRYGSPAETQTLGRRRRRSGIPRSTGPSRETSPHRQPAGTGTGTGTGTGLRRPTVTGVARPLTAHRALQQSRDTEDVLAEALAAGRLSRPPVRSDQLSDGSPSEAGSVSSGRCSLDAALRRDQLGGWSSGPQSLGSLPSSTHEAGDRDVGEVIDQVASTQWSERREGLLALQAVLRSNRMLTASELSRLTELFTKMFMDTHTKVFSIFLESVQELVVQHNDDLGDWLRVLIARLLNKLGADLLGSVVQKIERTLDVVRASFPAGQQLSCLCHFLLDHHQTPNTRVKAAALRYMRALLEGMEPTELASADPDLPLAVTKVLGWTSDQKSVETRNGAKAVIVALFDLNTAEFTRILQQLPRMYQDSATEIMQQHLRRRASVDQSAALLRARSPGSPRSANGSSPAGPRGAGAGPRGSTENLLSRDDPSRSLRRATSELQARGADLPDGGQRGERDSTSQDSGISQVWQGSGRGPPPADEEDQLAAALADLHLEGPDDRRRALQTVCRLAKAGSEPLWSEHFSTVLHLLLDSLRDGGGAAREHVLTALTEMLRREPVAALFAPFSELVFLRVLEAHREPVEREVSRAAEQCAAALAARLPTDAAVSTLGPLVQAGQFPVNRAAINTLTRLMEQREPQTVLAMLPEVMPILLKAYDNSESSVRKAAVFCIVTIHAVVGEPAVEPHLASLSTTKMKLLRMYITRAQSADSSPRDSPRAEPASPN